MSERPTHNPTVNGYDDALGVAGHHLSPPWERQPGETSTAFAAFCEYRDIPHAERSVAELLRLRNARGARKRGGSSLVVGHVQAWCSKQQWVDRAAAWDGEKDRRKREAAAHELIEMARLHARVAAMHIDTLSKPAAELLRRIDQDPDLLSRLSTEALFGMVVAASRTIPRMANMERVSRADPQAEQIATFTGGTPVKPMSLLDAVEDAAAAWRALRDAGVLPEGME